MCNLTLNSYRARHDALVHNILWSKLRAKHAPQGVQSQLKYVKASIVAKYSVVREK